MAAAFSLGLTLSSGAILLLSATTAGAASIPAQTELSAEVTLLAAQGTVGRSNPIYDSYRPTFVFAGSKAEVMCAIKLPGGRDKVEPGETAGVTIRCIEPITVNPEKPTFKFKEGGRLVGDGELRLAGPH